MLFSSTSLLSFLRSTSPAYRQAVRHCRLLLLLLLPLIVIVGLRRGRSGGVAVAAARFALVDRAARQGGPFDGGAGGALSPRESRVLAQGRAGAAVQFSTGREDAVCCVSAVLCFVDDHTHFGFFSPSSLVLANWFTALEGCMVVGAVGQYVGR
ncbi:hypothetical protein F4810DRAFT_682460 [Camillea tinctor]|nr:hypothetical protein F4810DRAFT_682460 [Camillea tinctor]